MKALVSKTLVVSVALFMLVTWVRAQSSGDRPPGVAQESWIPISDSAGILVLDTSPPFGGLTDPLPPNVSVASRAPITGVLVAKHNGVWARIEMPEPPARARPLRK